MVRWAATCLAESRRSLAHERALQDELVMTDKGPVPHKDRRRQNRLIVTLAVLCAALGLLLYANTIGFDYAFDDYSTIKDNRIVREGISGIPSLLNTSALSGYRTSGDELYRPLSLVMFALEWQFFPNNPAVGHAVNVTLYALTGSLLFVLLNRLFGSRPVIPFIATVLFMAHPVHTEVVANIKGRDEILGLLLGLLSMVLLLDDLDNHRKAGRILAGFTFLLALMAKESAITMLVVIPLAFHVFRDTPWRKIPVVVLPLLAGTSIYLVVRVSALHAVMNARTYSMLDNVVASAPHYSDRCATALYVLGKYLLLLVYPAHLSMDYSFREIELVGFSDPAVLLSLVVYTAMAMVAVLFMRKSGAVAFGIWYYLATISIASNLVILIGTVMAERLLYTPSLGVCLVAAVLLARSFPSVSTEAPVMKMGDLIRTNKNVFVATGVIMTVFAFRTIDRAQVWRDNATLFRSGVEDAPASSRTHLLYGMELAIAADRDSSRRDAIDDHAMVEFKKAIELYPLNVDAYREIGLLYHARKQYAAAVASYDKALALAPREVKTLNNKGVTRLEPGEHDEATR